MRHSTGADPGGAAEPNSNASRTLTTCAIYHGDLKLVRKSRGAQQEDNVTIFDKAAVDIAVVLGTTTMPVHQVLRLGRGDIIELDASEDDAVNVLANKLPIAKGTVAVNGNRIAVEVGQLLPRPTDVR
jgi:flagellar motor switch protein FliN